MPPSAGRRTQFYTLARAFVVDPDLGEIGALTALALFDAFQASIAPQGDAGIPEAFVRPRGRTTASPWPGRPGRT